VKKLLPAVALAAGALLAGCAGPAGQPASTAPRMSVDETCKFLNTDTFAPTGSEKQQAQQISQHYQDVADKVAPEVAAPIQKMSDIMKDFANSSLAAKTADQTAQLREQLNKIGQYCK
jgi:ABC-type Fe2+-enterobactin transport system substrate-binding protein